MPTTVNGVGTHYYGKKNLLQRPGVCRQCGRNTTLSSYDTRLWFVVVFIPIIPLGKKRIIDDCSGCRRHYAADAEKWEAAKQLEISGAMEKFRAAGTPETAMAAHQQLLNFQQLEDAAEFRRKLAEQFPDHAPLYVYFGESLAALGRHADAAPHYARALQLRPDSPEARTGVARDHLAAGRLDDARALLDFLQQTGAGKLYDLSPIENLGLAYQKAGRHDDALAMFRVLVEELPSLHNHRTFRGMVRRSEKAAGRSESLLKTERFQWRQFIAGTAGYAKLRNWCALGAAVLLVLGGLAVANEYVRRHREVVILNALPGNARVRIDGVGEFHDFGHSVRVPLAEGKYHAVVTAPLAQEFDFEVAADYFDRWGDDPLWVINLGGAALLMREEAHYGGSSPAYAFRFGQPFESFSGVTHPFANLPETVSVKRGETKTLTSVTEVTAEPIGIFRHLSEADRNTAMALGEWYLSRHPTSGVLFHDYCDLAGDPKSYVRVNAFLKSKLADRPVRVEWHRAYQNLHRHGAALPELAAEYDQALAATPDDAALLYLRGRIELEPRKLRSWMERSREADPKNPYPLGALGYRAAQDGEWDISEEYYREALERAPDDRRFEEFHVLAQLGIGAFATIEKEARAVLKRTSATDSSATRHLIESLARQNRAADIAPVCADYAKAQTKAYGDDGKANGDAMRVVGLYAAGNFAELEKVAQGTKTNLREERFAALVELGRLDEARKLLAKQDAAAHLALALALFRASKAPEAEPIFQLALDSLNQGDAGESAVARRLREKRALSLEEARAFDLTPQTKAVLVAAAAQRQTEQRGELLQLARRLNVRPAFPYHLVERICATP